MDFRITKAKYNCNTNIIDIEYSGKYNGEELTILDDVTLITYPVTLNGTTLELSGITIGTGGFIINKSNSKSSTNIEFQTYFFVNCENLCNSIVINKGFTSEDLLENGECHDLTKIDFVHDNMTDLYSISFTYKYFKNKVGENVCGELYSNTVTFFAPLHLYSYVGYNFLTFACEPSGLGGFGDGLAINKYEILVNVYNKYRCLINQVHRKVDSNLNDKFQIGYDCKSGLRYFYFTDLDVEFDGGVLPPIGTKLKAGIYNVKVSKKCPLFEEDCNALPICITLKVNCLTTGTPTNNETCIEDFESLVKIENLENCNLKVTNISNKALKIRRNVLTSTDRSCSGEIIIQGNEFTILPTQSKNINNEGSGYDSKLEITYTLPSGDGECKSSTCLPYCDLSIINDRNGLKTLVIKKGIVGDDTVATIFNPLTNGIVKATFLVGGKEYTESIKAGSYAAIKIGSGTKEISYTMASHKNYEVVKKGRAYISKVEEITTGITYTDSTVSGTEITFIVKST